MTNSFSFTDPAKSIRSFYKQRFNDKQSDTSMDRTFPDEGGIPNGENETPKLQTKLPIPTNPSDVTPVNHPPLSSHEAESYHKFKERVLELEHQLHLTQLQLESTKELMKAKEKQWNDYQNIVSQWSTSIKVPEVKSTPVYTEPAPNYYVQPQNYHYGMQQMSNYQELETPRGSNQEVQEKEKHPIFKARVPPSVRPQINTHREKFQKCITRK